MRRTLTALTLAAALPLLAACAGGGAAGGEDTVTVEPGGTAPSGAGTELTIELDESGTGETSTFHLTCDPAGGDHPDAEAACQALADAGGAAAFTPVAADMMCTQIYGGPQTARVIGTVDGQQVEGDFKRTDGCEIGRWDAIAPLLGSAGGAQGS